jgi:sulfide:quinone oxidoreductase
MNSTVRKEYSVLIIGGGAGGISVAARLQRADHRLDIAIVEPAAFHYYQPAWTLVGAGQYDAARTQRPMADCIPRGVAHIAARVSAFDPANNQVVTEDGARLGYQYLVVAAGIQLNWDAIEGLADALGKNGVTSNYRYDLAPYTWQCLQDTKDGSALFTQPPMPIKCAGAPQKILYLAADHFKRAGRKIDLQFFTPGAAMFGVPFYSKALDKIMAAYGAAPRFGHNLVAVDGAARLATFEVVANGEKTRQTLPFSMLHVVPPQSAPDFIKKSELADAAGWLEVDRANLRHVRYANIYGLGDCTSTPNSKTAAAVKNQTPVVVANLLRAIKNRGVARSYDGYASCPLTTSAGKVMLAEFCYDGVITPSFPADPRVPRRFYWWLKRSFLPFLYWHILLKGRAWLITHKKRDFPEAVPPIAP